MLKLVWLDDDFRPMRVPDAFRETVRAFEGEHLTEADGAVADGTEADGKAKAPKAP